VRAAACDIISNSATCLDSHPFLNMTSDCSSFLNYPPPREGPAVPYKNDTQSIPVFRGTPLAIGATL